MKHSGVLMNLFKHVHVLEVFGSVGFWGEGKTGVPREKPLGARERTNNKLNPHMALMPGFERRARLMGGERFHHCATLAPQTYFLDPWDFHRNFFHKMKSSKCPEKEKKNEELWTFKYANKLVLGTWHTGLNLYFSLIQSLALKQWHKTRWNDDKWHNDELGLNPLATWPTPQNAE